MKILSRLAAAATAGLLLATTSVTPASAAPQIDVDPRPTFPGLDPIDISLPPERVGDLECWQGFVIGDFTDLDQDDSTLRVYGVVNDSLYVEYPTLQALGAFVFIPPFRDIQMNLIAYDEDGNKAIQRAVSMRPDGTCSPYNWSPDDD